MIFLWSPAGEQLIKEGTESFLEEVGVTAARNSM
jgi:hypothetical protein